MKNIIDSYRLEECPSDFVPTSFVTNFVVTEARVGEAQELYHLEENHHLFVVPVFHNRVEVMLEDELLFPDRDHRPIFLEVELAGDQRLKIPAAVLRRALQVRARASVHDMNPDHRSPHAHVIGLKHVRPVNRHGDKLHLFLFLLRRRLPFLPYTFLFPLLSGPRVRLRRG